MSSRSDADAFQASPHKTLLRLSVPVLFSLIAEPLTGVVDTFFAAGLGSEAQAALGVGTIALSAVFWIFNFLGIGTQSEVAQRYGAGREQSAAEISALAMAMAFFTGLFMILVGWPLSHRAALLLGAEGRVLEIAADYIQIRLLGAPAVLITIAGFGALRGIREMRIPLWVATAINLINMVLDYPLIVGWGPIPPLGMSGAAWASIAGQWLGALWTLRAVRASLGRVEKLPAGETRKLLRIGGDLFIRTGMLTLFLLLCTRWATRAGAGAGAVHQAIRQMWFFTALLLDAFAISGQSLIGYFFGAGRRELMKQVATVVCLWSFATGILLSLAMWLGSDWVQFWLVPQSAWPLFALPWIISLLAQPLNALAFATDGLHWGTGDFAYLRNATSLSTVTGAALLLLIPEDSDKTLLWIWGFTTVWIFLRALLGMLRIWPGIGRSPFAARSE